KPRRGRLRQGWRIRTVRQAAVNDEGTAAAAGRRAGGICTEQNRKYPQAGKVCASLEGKLIKEKPSRQSRTK
ncbi:hypothetical protein, partial [Pantoea ananatis]|uniref:hypothetical protein n=2 Tax=Pantoea ananas TaxID=553 RepID=UPI001B300A7E